MVEKFSASRAERLMHCPGSARLDEAIPGWVPPVVDDTAGQKGDGTRMHFALAEMVELTTPGQYTKLLNCLVELEFLRSSRRFKTLIEEEVVAEWLPSKPRTTVDLVLYTRDELHIWDWKWGKIPQPVEGNPQLLFYARSFIHLAPKAKFVTLHVAQPLADGYTQWVVSMQDLAAWAVEAIAADKRILDGDLTLVPSDDGCTFCPANPHSRGDKGTPLCPVMMDVLYPNRIDADAILDL